MQEQRIHSKSTRLGCHWRGVECNGLQRHAWINIYIIKASKCLRWTNDNDVMNWGTCFWASKQPPPPQTATRWVDTKLWKLKCIFPKKYVFTTHLESSCLAIYFPAYLGTLYISLPKEMPKESVLYTITHPPPSTLHSHF